jgi:hypothetical protein
MQKLSKKEQKRIIESPPVGTWALMLTVGIGFVLGWLFLYYGVFLPRGAVH